MKRHCPPRIERHRGGFTLIELLIVIAIIAILAAFLVPATTRAIRNARVTGVATEITQFEAAIAKFKVDHGIEPPSSIKLYETAAGWASDTVSSSLIRQIWPQFDFGAHDINGDGTSNGPWTLTVGECLVFFLGGVNGNVTSGLSSTSPNNNPGHIGACTGFSKNPNSPFDRGGSREAPLFEFNASRFTDLDSDGFPEYKDTLPNQKMPYLYYSGYDGQGYAVSAAGAGTIYLSQEFGSPALTQCYYQDANMTQAWKPNSHQIVSPGYDGQYGFGGPYISKGNPPLPAGSGGTPSIAQRKQELDNITNFSSGELSPN